jgi:hypothetical protein
MKYSGKKTAPLPLYPPQIPHGLACGGYSPPFASRAGGTCCVLHKVLEDCLHLRHLPEELASICIIYQRNLPPSAGRPLNASVCITYGRNVLLHLHNMSEELTTTICITYGRNLNAFICTTYHSARTCQMLLQTLPEFAVPYSPCLQAIFVCLNCPT